MNHPGPIQMLGRRKPSVRPLTLRQAQVLLFLRGFIGVNGMPPTRAEIAKHFGWKSPNAAEEHLRAIAAKGAIYLTGGIARGIHLA